MTLEKDSKIDLGIMLPDEREINTVIFDDQPTWLTFTVDEIRFDDQKNKLYSFGKEPLMWPMPHEMTFEFESHVFKYRLVDE